MYLIPLGILVVSVMQVSAPESSTTVDVIYLYFSTVRSRNMYSIPPGSVVLTSVQVHKVELV